MISPAADVWCSAHTLQLLLINRWALAKLLCEGRRNRFFVVFFSQRRGGEAGGGGSNLYQPPARPVLDRAHRVSSHHMLICVASARCVTLRPCGALKKKKDDVWGLREVIFLIVASLRPERLGNHCATAELCFLSQQTACKEVISIHCSVSFFRVISHRRALSDGHNSKTHHPSLLCTWVFLLGWFFRLFLISLGILNQVERSRNPTEIPNSFELQNRWRLFVPGLAGLTCGDPQGFFQGQRLGRLVLKTVTEHPFLVLSH